MTTFRAFDFNRSVFDYATRFEDFHNYLAADWLVTTVGSGTVALASGVGGRLLITNSAADDDSVSLQYKGSNAAAQTQWAYTTGKKLQFIFSGQISDATQSDLIAGLYAVDTSPIASAPTNGIYFRKDDGSTRLKFSAAKAGAVTDVDTGIDMVAGTDYRMEFYYDGSRDRIGAWVNGTNVGSILLTALPASATVLSLSMSFQNGEAVAKTANIDYIGAQVQR